VEHLADHYFSTVVESVVCCWDNHNGLRRHIWNILVGFDLQSCQETGNRLARVAVVETATRGNRLRGTMDAGRRRRRL
jgi:hypothetical protein